MRFDERRVRRVIAPPRRDIREGIDLTILDEDSLRWRRLGDDDLPASQRNGGRADADAALPAPGGKWAVLGHDRHVGGGEGGAERLGRCPRCRGKGLRGSRAGQPRRVPFLGEKARSARRRQARPGQTGPGPTRRGRRGRYLPPIPLPMRNRRRSRWRGPWVFTSPAAAGATECAAKSCPEAGASGFLTRGAETVLSGAIECSRRVYVRLRYESVSR